MRPYVQYLVFVTPFILILQMFELTRPSQRYRGPDEFKEAFSDSHACDYNSGPREPALARRTVFLPVRLDGV